MSAPLTFIDLGGVIDDKNPQICSLARHAILLVPEAGRLGAVADFSTGCRLRILAELLSDYHDSADAIHGQGRPFRASVHRLERGA